MSKKDKQEQLDRGKEQQQDDENPNIQLTKRRGRPPGSRSAGPKKAVSAKKTTSRRPVKAKIVAAEPPGEELMNGQETAINEPPVSPVEYHGKKQSDAVKKQLKKLKGEVKETRRRLEKAKKQGKKKKAKALKEELKSLRSNRKEMKKQYKADKPE